MDESNSAAVQAAGAAGKGSGLATQIFSGVGLGLLLGIVAGLSVSPVVQVILGAMVTVVTGFLSLQGGSSDGASGNLLGRMKMNEVRIGSFGLACVMGIVLGLVVRSNNPFVSIDKQVEKWTHAGYSKEDAQMYVAFQTLGIKPQGMEVVTGDLQKAKSSALFADTSKIRLCDELAPSKFDNDPGRTLAAYNRKSAAFSEKLSPFAAEVQKLSPENQEKILEANWAILCELEKSK